MIETHDKANGAQGRVDGRVNGIVAAVLSASIAPLHGALAREKRKTPDPRLAPTRERPRIVVAQ
jgi:hypothetical protein